MRVYVWQTRKGYYAIALEAPQIAKSDHFLGAYRKGDPLSTVSTINFDVPDDLRPHLPAVGEVREMLFYERLWDVAKSLSSYDKKLWIDLQHKLEMEILASRRARISETVEKTYIGGSTDYVYDPTAPNLCRRVEDYVNPPYIVEGDGK